MRALSIVAVLVALVVGAVTLFVFQSRQARTAEIAAVQRAEEAASVSRAAEPAAPDVRIEAMQRAIDSLSMQVSQLSSEVQALRGPSERTPATADAAPTQPTEAELAASALSETEREQVRDVLAQEFKRQEDERAAQRAKREQEAAERRADSIAKKLNLAAKDTARLSEILVAENQKRRELFDNIQDSGFDREQMRQTMGELMTWKKDELTQAFGTALADQISELDQPRRGGFGGDFGGPGGGGGRGNRGGGGGGGNGGGGD
jgi:hypothetical protein